MLLLIGFLPSTVKAQVTINALASPSNCLNTGSIKITATGLPSLVTYGIAKVPFNPTNVISNTTAEFTMLEPGDYYYGYYSGSTFVKSTATVKVENTYSAISPTFQSYSAKYYAYCGAVDPLGTISGIISGGNKPFKIELLNTSGSAIQEKSNFTEWIFVFYGVPAGEYRLRATDACGTIVTAPTSIVLKPNVPYDFSLAALGSVSDTYFDVVYNTPDDICSGIKTAAINKGRFLLSGEIIDGTDTPFGTQDKPKFYGTKSPVYKLEVQNETGAWDVYDNLDQNAVNNGNFALPLDQSKWAGVKLSATICGITRTNQRDLSSYAGFKKKPLGTLSTFIFDDPANTICTKTGKVLARFDNSTFLGCYPISIAVTERGTTNTQQGSILDKSTNRYAGFLLDIGKKYTVVIKDAEGELAMGCFFYNKTSSTSSKPLQSNLTNLDINPVYFTPNAIIRDQITFIEGPDTKNFGKSALMVRGINKILNFTGSLHFNSVSGPTTINKTVAANLIPANSGSYKEIGLGDNLAQGTYKIRITDEGCFDEVYDVIVESYIISVTLENVIDTPSTTVCDRYIKSGNIRVTAVGKSAERELRFIYGYPKVYVGLVSGPLTLSKYRILAGFEIEGNAVIPFSFEEDVAGKYEVALTQKYDPNSFIPLSEVAPTSAVIPLNVLPNYPVFDLIKSGGVICAGNTTGTLSVKVDNTTGAVTYFIKKDTDANFPAVGQASNQFLNLPPGNYVVKVKTACYEVIQPFTLQLLSSASSIIEGDTNFCSGESLNLSLLSLGSITTVSWTLPDNSVVSGTPLHIDNLTPAHSGVYKVEVLSASGCTFTQSVTVKVKPRATAANILGPNDYEVCIGTGASYIARPIDMGEKNLIFNWYSDAALTNLLGTGAVFVVNSSVAATYYITMQSDNFCENLPGTAKAFTVTVAPRAPAGAITAMGATICAGESVRLRSTSSIPLPSTTKWYSGNIVGSSQVGNGDITVTPDVTTTYYVGISGGGFCETYEADRTPVTVTVRPKATATDILVNSMNVCVGESATFTATSTTVTNPVFKWYRSTGATTFTELATGPTFTPQASDYSGVGEVVYYVSVSGDEKCENEMAISKMKKVSLVVKRSAVATDITASNVTICHGDTAHLTATTALSNPVFNWYSNAVSTTAMATGSNYNVNPTVTTTYYVAVSGDNTCENTASTRKEITVTVNPKATEATITVTAVKL
ncbi:hypothetical protein [Flavobacterium sp. '19STA2R22 D10 B1']|uniref:Ig-like domain-containing protein n=1 Tax=Flavobacterium aerium TaxID=3037261 RepID=UPI00278C77CF|nr:hypothetical protein [Flavobacterium sp. '19STA2R22 D10 B1']